MRMMSIDPGTVTCGVCIMDVDDKFNISNLSTFTIYINNELNLDTRIFKLYNIFTNLMINYEPYLLIHESAFINRLRPQAYGPIYTTIYLLRRAFINTYGEYGIFMYPPKTVKSVVSTGDAGKDDMLYAVSNISELSRWLTGSETEHEIDAIAIGYTHLLNIRTTPELLLI